MKKEKEETVPDMIRRGLKSKVKGKIKVSRAGQIPKHLIRFVENERGEKLKRQPKYYTVEPTNPKNRIGRNEGWALQVFDDGEKAPTDTMIVIPKHKNMERAKLNAILVHEVAELIHHQDKKSSGATSHKYAKKVENKFKRVHGRYGEQLKKRPVRKKRKQTKRRSSSRLNFSNMRI